MAFTLSAAQAIDGVANSYEVTGDGNLDDLATACSAIGMTRKDNTITFSPGVARILAISGALTEQRDGVYNVRVMGSGHICWAYASGSSVVLGKTPSANGFSTSVVNISYDSDASGFGDAFQTARGKCIIGLGSFTHNSGSQDVRGNTGSQLVYDVWSNESGGAVFLDDVAVYAQHNHFFSRSNVSTSTRTRFGLPPTTSGGSNLEAVNTFTEIKPISTTNGILVLSLAANKTLRVIQPSYPKLCSFGGASTATLVAVDPDATYMGNDERQESNTGARASVIDINRTMRISLLDGQSSAPVASAKAIVMDGTTPSVTSFNGSTAIERRQSRKPNGTKHYATGTGWTDNTQNPFLVHLVAFGYSAKKSINIKTEMLGNAGVPWAANAIKSPLVTSAYASVVTAPFTMSTASTGLLTVGAAATSAQVAEFLFKSAFDAADVAFWRGLDHVPATGTADAINIGAIGLALNAVLSGGDLTTTGAVTIGAGAMPQARISASTITVPGVNTARLSATTSIQGLPTTGTISTAGRLGFGSGTTIAATGDLVISNTELSGNLVINTAVARRLTLQNCTGSLASITVTGGGSLNVLLTSGTASTVAPASLGAGVTLASVVNFASAAAFNLLTIVDFGGAGEVEQLQTGASSYTVLVPPGKALRYAYGALGKVPGYFNEGAISVSKDINLALLDDTLISTTTDLTSAQSLLAWDTLNTSTNKLVMRMGAGSLDPVSAQAGISWLSWQHQSLRLIARTGISTHITTTASGSKFGTTAITIGGKSTNGALDISEILAFVEAPSGHIINPKSTGAAGEPPTGFQVTVTKVRPTIAKVEDSQLAAISALTTANIEASAVIAKAAALVSLQTDVTAVKAKTDNLPAAPAAVGSAMTLTSDYDAAKSAASQASVNAIPTNPVLTSDSRLSNLDAAVSTRLASSAYTAPDNAGVAAVKAKTDALPAEPAAVGSAMTLTAAYDAAKTAATQTSVTALGAPAQATALASLVTVNQAEHDATQAAIAVLPVPPAAASVATAVRTELAAELGRVDAAVSTRLATAGYTAPPAASAIRAELEVTGGKLDKAMKAAQSAEENTV